MVSMIKSVVFFLILSFMQLLVMRTYFIMDRLSSIANLVMFNVCQNQRSSMPTNIPGALAKAQRVAETVCPSIPGSPVWSHRWCPKGTVDTNSLCFGFHSDHNAAGSIFCTQYRPACGATDCHDQPCGIGTTKSKCRKSWHTHQPDEEGKQEEKYWLSSM